MSSAIITLLLCVLAGLLVNELLLFEWTMHPERYKHLNRDVMVTMLLITHIVYLVLIVGPLI